MAIAVANANNHNGEPCYNVIGLDLPIDPGMEKINAVINGDIGF
ncbi:hypothetical protein OAH91_00320 [Emcibacteraceae bacterium]|nr:hypothetical protein [Emcibacteraceae bacterium]